MNSNLTELTAISPIDGRYRDQVKELSEYFSEYAYIKYRLDVEIKYLIELSKVNVIRHFTKNEIKPLNALTEEFDLKKCSRVKEIESETKHDLKAIEYYIKEEIAKTSLADVAEYIHFGLTSEDTNNIAQRLMIKDATSSTLIPCLKLLASALLKQANEYKDIVILARTHGQPAVPSTLGKEFKVFQYRLVGEIEKLQNLRLRGKLNGAVGNYNALSLAYPKINWLSFSKTFTKSLGLDTSLITTQINNPEDFIEYFQIIQRINGILLDLNQDLWRYISDNWFVLKREKDEVGSSTMPQKVNPIMFENSEGNIVVANSLIDGYVNKLPVSRLQRDLSGSTIIRTFGTTLSHSLVAWKNATLGLRKISPNLTKINEDLTKDYSILGEALQILLKQSGQKNGYEIAKKLTRGRQISKTEWSTLLKELNISMDLEIQDYKGLTEFE